MVNKVILVGRLGADPELRSTSTGTAVTKFNVATSESYTDKAGIRQERTDWHRIVVWGKQGENCAQYLAKGSLVFIEGRLRNDTWEKDGVKQHSYEVTADRVRFLESRRERGGGGPERSDDDVPF